MSKFTSSTKWAKAYLINYISISCRKVWVIPSFFAVCHRLNDKGLHDFEKRMIISKLLGGGGGGGGAAASYPVVNYDLYRSVDGGLQILPLTIPIMHHYFV